LFPWIIGLDVGENILSVLACFILIIGSCIAMAYLKVSLLISTILMGLLLALLTVTVKGLAISIFFITCWVAWACIGSLNFSGIRNTYVLQPSRQFYERKIEHLSRYQKAAVMFSPESLTRHPYNEKDLSDEETRNLDHTFRHIQFILFNVAQAIYMNLRNRFISNSADDATASLNLRVMATISSYHTIIEYLLIVSHSDDSRSAAFDNRIETIILHLQLIICLVKQYKELERSDEPSVLLTYALSEAFSAIYSNLRELLRNSSGRLLDQFVSLAVFPLCQWAQPPLDDLRLKAVNEIQDKDIFTSEFFDKHSGNIVFDDRNLTIFLTYLLDPSSQTVFDAYQKDFHRAVSSSNTDR